MHADDDAKPMDKPTESAFDRWVRRKHAARHDVTVERPAESDHAGRSEVIADIELPTVESLHERSDLSVFFAQTVSEDLRRVALRKVFSLPRYNFTDGLDDYAEDYTRYRPLGDLVTAGVRHFRERASRLAQADADAQPAHDTDEARVTDPSADEMKTGTGEA